MTTGERIKETRLKRGLTQKQLSEKCNLNVNSISMYERNNVRPKIEFAERIASALDVQVSWLLGFNSDEEMRNSAEAAKLEAVANIQELEMFFGKGFWKFLTVYEDLNAAGRKLVYEHAKLLTKIQDYRLHPAIDLPRLDDPISQFSTPDDQTFDTPDRRQNDDAPKLVTPSENQIDE